MAGELLLTKAATRALKNSMRGIDRTAMYCQKYGCMLAL
jgi:hypothetical protein